MAKPKAGEIRSDLIKRLFAVAISVGFATALARLDWVKNGTWPSQQDYEQLSILLVGLVATVLSWDGYLASIAVKSLEKFWRFGIDIVLVFVYMLLLITSPHPYLWLPILVIIFVLYVVWDMLSILEYTNQYDTTLVGAGIVRVPKVYLRGLLSRAGTSRGPIATLCWGIYFIILAALNFQTAKYQVFVMCFLALLGLVA